MGKWLNRFNLGLYESYLLANGFDDLEFLVSYEIRSVVNEAHASPCKPMQAHASPCKPMQAHASPCKPMQAHASPCKPMQAHASPCKPMQCAVGSAHRLIRIVLTVVSPIYTVIILQSISTHFSLKCSKLRKFVAKFKSS